MFSAATLEPCHSPHDIVVSNHLHCKLQQKQAYDKHARHLLPNFPPSSYVFAKPSPNSRSKAWVPGKIIGSAGHRSYYFKTGTRQIRRNHVEVQLAPPLNNVEPLPETDTNSSPPPNLPDKLQSYSPNPTSSFASSATPTAAPDDVDPSPLPSTVSSSTLNQPQSAPDTPTPPCLHKPPMSNAPPQSPSSSNRYPSGQVVRKPAHFSD